MKILNFGSLNIDNVYEVDHMVVEGETLSSTGMSIMCGGKGLNQSIALAKAGLEVYHAGQIGEEGQILVDCLKENGVNTDYTRQVPGRSGHTIIQVDRNAKNCILLYGGSNRSLTKEFIDEVLSHFGSEDVLVLQNEVNLIGYIVDAAYERGMKIVLNPSPFDHYLDEVDYGKISMLLMNEVEGWQVTGEKEADKILAVLREKFPDMEVILTLGEAGSVYQKGDERVAQGIFKVKAVDTTAAGDTFTGFFLSARAKGKDVQESLRLAAKASSIAVTRNGAAASIPLWDEVAE